MIRISDERISELLTQADGLAHKSGSIFKSLARLVEDEVIARIDAERGKAEVLQAQEPQRLKVVYAASNSVSSVVFANHDDAVKYAANCGAACGVTVTEIQVAGTATQPPVTCQCADPEQIIALQHAADTAEAQALDNEKLRAEVERLTKERDTEIARNNPLRAIAKSQEERIAYLAINCRGLDEVRATLESERSANEALTLEVAQQSERIAELEHKSQSLARSVMADQTYDETRNMFHAAILDLAAINEALDCDPDDGGAVPIIEAIDELKETIAAQSAALAKAKDALEGVCDSDEECQDSDGWTAAVISLEAMHEAQEALEAIAQLDGAQYGEHAQPAGDADNAIYLGIARNYDWIDWRGAPGGKRPVKDDQTIEVELVCGEKHVDRAGKFDFRWFGNYEHSDIVRYRIIADEEEKESRND